MMYKERKTLQVHVHDAVRWWRRHEDVWEPPVERYIRITPINNTSASVTTLRDASPTKCFCVVTLRWIQSSSHVQQPHLCCVYACRHLQTHGSFRELWSDRETTWQNCIRQVEHFCKLRLNCCESYSLWNTWKKETPKKNTHNSENLFRRSTHCNVHIL